MEDMAELYLNKCTQNMCDVMGENPAWRDKKNRLICRKQFPCFLHSLNTIYEYIMHMEKADVGKHCLLLHEPVVIASLLGAQ